MLWLLGLVAALEAVPPAKRAPTFLAAEAKLGSVAKHAIGAKHGVDDGPLPGPVPDELQPRGRCGWLFWTVAVMTCFSCFTPCAVLSLVAWIYSVYYVFVGSSVYTSWISGQKLGLPCWLLVGWLVVWILMVALRFFCGVGEAICCTDRSEKK